jgi:hypothetical protein
MRMAMPRATVPVTGFDKISAEPALITNETKRGRRRFGHFLHNQNRDEYVLSMKIGRILKASDVLPRTMWKEPSPFSYEYDYTAAGVRHSIEPCLRAGQ